MNPKRYFKDLRLLTPEERFDRFTDILAETVVRHLIGNQEQKTDHETGEPEPVDSVEKPL